MTTVTSSPSSAIQPLNQRIMSFTPAEDPALQALRGHEGPLAKEIVEQSARTPTKPVSADVIDRGRPTAATIAFTLSYQGKNANTVQQVQRVDLLEEEEGAAKQAEEPSRPRQAGLAEIESRIVEFKKGRINDLPEMMQLVAVDLERNLEEATAKQLRGLREREGVSHPHCTSGNKTHAEKEDELHHKRIEELKVCWWR